MNLTRPEGPDATITLSRRGLTGAMGFAGFAAAIRPVHAAAITTPSDGLISEMITLPSQGFDLPAFVARPQVKGRKPVVCSFPRSAGLNVAANSNNWCPLRGESIGMVRASGTHTLSGAWQNLNFALC